MPLFFGEVAQDYFVLTCLKNKRNGTFIEIGSNHPMENNNSFLLECKYGWKGIMVEYNADFLPKYIKYRQNSHHLIHDATTVDYLDLLKQLNYPKDIDYLQIDLDVDNKSTISTLEHMEQHVFDDYTFATVTFEHDIYRGDWYNTRVRSREIFEKRGYVRVFSDVAHAWEDGVITPFEDWYVHPSLVDMDLVSQFITPPSTTESFIRHTDILTMLEKHSTVKN